MASTGTEDIPPDKVFMMDYSETLYREEWKVSRECADEMMRTINGLRVNFTLDQVTKGDGQCFATSTIQQLRRPEVNNTLSLRMQKLSRACDPRALKYQVKAFMMKSKHTRVQSLKEDLQNFTGKSWEQYWKDMMKMDTWADEFFVRSTAWFLNLDIIIHQNINSSPIRSISGNMDDPETLLGGTQLFMGYLLNRHYQSVLPRVSNQSSLVNHQNKNPSQASAKISASQKTTKSNITSQPTAVNVLSQNLCPICGKEYKNVPNHLKRAKKCKDGATDDLIQKLSARSKDTKAENRKRKIIEDPEKAKSDRKRWNESALLKYGPKKMKEDRKKWKKSYEKKQTSSKLKEDNRRWKKSYQDKQTPEKLKDDNMRWKKSYQDKQTPEKLKDNNRRWVQNSRQVLTEEERLQSFLENSLFGPIFVCISCHQKHFFTNVQIFTSSLQKIVQEKIPLENCIFDMKLRENMKFGEIESSLIKIESKDQFICKTCLGYLRKAKLPPSSVMNNLQLSQTDKQLEDEGLVLTELENSLIASRIIFQKIFLLPKSRWSAMKDKQINIPITSDRINETLVKLPRTPQNAGLIGVELKRKLEFKNNHKKQLINPHKLFDFIEKAKQCGNPYYRDVSTFETYQHMCREEESGYNIVFGNADKNEAEEEEDEPMLDEGDTEDKLIDEILDEEYEAKDSVKKYQFQYNNSIVMTDKFPESNVSVAPGEDQVPKKLLFDDNWDVMAFPSIHNCDGSNGKDQEREVSLTAQRYFVQRITNINSRFSKCSPYLYSAVGFLEEQRIHRSINLVGTRGKKLASASGKARYELYDPYNAIEAIPGSPKYWQKAKYEILAKIDNFGAFQVFYTLSCGDQRWFPNFAAILLEKGYSFKYEVQKEENHWKQVIHARRSKKDKWKPLKDFLKEDIDESHHELIRGNVVTATRYFDQRVKSFLRDIVMHSSNPMAAKYYTYKVEFQARGAGHIHGTLWMDLEMLEELIRVNGKLVYPKEKESSERRPLKGIKEAFNSLRNDETLTKKCMDVLISFADEFSTVTTHAGSVGVDVAAIARDVNMHHHTHTCRKYNNECRFGFPKLPSPETLIAQPVKGDTETRKRILKKCHQTISKVKEVLDDKEKMDKIMKKFNKNEEAPGKNYKKKRLERIELLLKEASVTMEDYKTALQSKQSGYSIILARDVDEIFINNYNVEWLRAWNANLDVQICLDFHAVVTYITDYYSKCETELVKLIKVALEKSDGTDNKEKMKIVSNVFQRSRQMGEAEAVYKLIPNMVLTNSNVTCQWVALGTVEERSSRYQKAKQQHIDAGIPLTELEGHEGLWYQQQDIWSKYLRRPDALKTISFAQFSKMYRSSYKKPAEDEDKYEDVDDDNVIEGEIPEEISKFHYIMTFDGNRRLKLPEIIALKKPHPGEAYIMQRRSSPAALRFHKIKEKNDSERYFFNEVMLYYPLDREISISEARQMYQETFKGRRKVNLVKTQVMEYLEGVEEARYHLEMLENEPNFTETAGTLDAQGLKENEECNDLEEETSEYDHLNPDDLLLRKDKTASGALYKKIEIPSYDELRRKTRSLDKYQREVLNIMIKYAKDLVKCRNHRNKPPQPPYLMMHGGAGSGKSTVIRIITQWVQKILQQEGQSPECPNVVVTAFCGTAAANVDGQTLNSSFGFSFDNKHNALGNKSRDMRRAILKYLKLVIVDEISMVKADMLYQLDLRLQEITEKMDIPFGGIGVLVFGDLMQLPPVQGRYVFDVPVNKEFFITHGLTPRWTMFKPVLLEENHRQGSDRSYADLLNRIRIKQFTEEDIKILQERVRSPSHEDIKNAGLHITAKRDPCDKINQKYIAKLDGVPLKLKAVHHHPINPNYKPYINKKDQTIAETGFRDEIILKPGARIIMIHNLDTVDSLTNGQLGTFVDAVKNKMGKVEKLVLKLDKPGAGKHNREQNPELVKKFQDHIFIERVSMQYSTSKKNPESSKATLIQFPIRLAFATTAHKIQGSSIPYPTKVVLDIESCFASGQAYVMLSRVQCLDQVFILGKFQEKKLMMSANALTELQRLESVSLNRNPGTWMANAQLLRVASVNCAGLQAHFEDIILDKTLLRADIILLQETSLEIGETKSFEIPSHPFQIHVRKGKGKGITVYCQKPIDDKKIVKGEGFQIIRITVDHMDVFNVYRSSTGSKVELCEALSSLIERSKPSMICGDLNICGKTEKNNQVSRFLCGQGFEQLVKEATQIKGRQIDHIFLKSYDGLKVLHTERYSPYYSDHDALLVSMAS